MRVSTSIVLAFFGAVASVYAASDVPDAAVIGTLPAFLKYQSMYTAGDHSSKVTDQLKSLGAKLDSQGTNLEKVLGSDAQAMDMLDMIDSHVALLDAGREERDLLSRATDDSEGCDEDKIAAPGKVEQFIALNKKLSNKDASKDPNYDSDLKKLHSLGKQVQKNGGKLDHVVGTTKFGKAVTKMIDQQGDDASASALAKVVKEALTGDSSSSTADKRDSGIAAPGKVEQFIALNQKLSQPDASKSSTYEADLKKFQTLGKQLQKEKVPTQKILGTTHTGVALEKLMTDVGSDVQNLAGMVTQLLGDLLKRDASGIAAPGKVEQFIALNQKLSQADASKSPTYDADVKKFQALGQALKKDGSAQYSNKALGTTQFATAAKKIISEPNTSSSSDLGSLLTKTVESLVKRDGLADLVDDVLPSVDNIKRLGEALTSKDALSSPHYEKSLKNLKQMGLQLKKQGKDPKTLVGSGDQAEALAEMFSQAGDKTSDVRDDSIPVLSGRSLHGNAHSHAAMARRRAHSHNLEN